MKKLGVYFGTFAPLHLGHQQQIYKAAFENDRLLVIVSGYAGDRGDQIGLPLVKRLAFLKMAFADESDFKLAALDETDLPSMPDGWDAWTARLLRLIRAELAGQNAQITFYVGEAEYVTELTKRFPQDGNTYAVELADRRDIPLSATLIRENPLRHYLEIRPAFRAHFSKFVTVLGAENDDLLRRLAHSSNSTLSVKFDRNTATDSGLVFVKSPSNLAEMDLILSLSNLTEQTNAVQLEAGSPLEQFAQAIAIIEEKFAIKIALLKK